MPGIPRRVALVSMHTSPAQQAGTGDAGGMNVALRSTASALAARGVEVELLTRASGPARERELEPGVTIHELRAGPPGPIDKTGLSEVSDEFGEAVAALAGRGSPRYDLIHAHYWLSGIAVLPVALELGVPFVQSFHTLAAMKNRLAPPGSPLEPERRLHSETYLANQASAIVAGSAAEATCLIDEVRAPADRIWVIPPGVDVELFRPNPVERGAGHSGVGHSGSGHSGGDQSSRGQSDQGRNGAVPSREGGEQRVREELAIEPGRPILVVAGRIQPLKDQELAIRALAELHAARGWAPALVIVGEATPGDEGYANGLRILAADLGVSREVRFTGALSRRHLAELFAAATLTLIPSHSETFGLVALESAASGTPVVGYRGTGLLESVAEGRSGLLVSSREPREWAATIGRLLDDPQALGRMSDTARDHALDFTWAASATALLGVYGSLL